MNRDSLHSSGVYTSLFLHTELKVKRVYHPYCIPKLIPLRLFLDVVTSSSVDNVTTRLSKMVFLGVENA